jgi:hypothetical protein
MSSPSDHGRLIAAAASRVLAPLGLVRKGRSRTWLDDHGWWLGIVEFQPSNWDRGTYLNVGAMFLWRPINHLSFEVGYRVDGFSSAQSDDFEAAVDAKIQLAVARLENLRAEFRSLDGVIAHFSASPRDLNLIREAHLATAYGLLGDVPRLQQGLDRALALREESRSGTWNSSAWLIAVREAARTEEHFREWVSVMLEETRSALKLPHSDGPLDPPSVDTP